MGDDDRERDYSVAHAHGLAKAIVTHPAPISDEGARAVAQDIMADLETALPTLKEH